jgi:hypothetical protein
MATLTQIFGANAGDHVGFPVNAAGDVNGDGIDDIIVSSYKTYESLETYTSWVLYGQPEKLIDINLGSLTQTQGFRIFGANDTAWQGQSISQAGDINADGIADIIVGIPGFMPAGISYVIYGQKGGLTDINLGLLNKTQGFRVFGTVSGDKSGDSVSRAGDVNADGIDDIIIGASNSSPEERQYAGVSYVIYGQKNGLADINLDSLTQAQGFRIIGAKANDYSGYSVSGAGDVNDDAIDDVIIGAPTGVWLQTVSDSYVVYGHKGGIPDIDLAFLTQTQGFRIIGSNDSNNLIGSSVEGIGDINADGVADITISACASSSGRGITKLITSYIIYGKQGGLNDINIYDFTQEQGFKVFLKATTQATGCIGSSISKGGDINYDGIDDIIISADWPSLDERDDPGVSYVLYGQKSGLIDIDLASLAKIQGFSIVGAELDAIESSGAGDVNADGISDIIIGAAYASPNGEHNAGISYVVYGQKGGLDNIDLTNINQRDDSSHVLEIVLGTVGGLVVVGLVAGLGYYLYKHYYHQVDEQQQPLMGIQADDNFIVS